MNPTNDETVRTDTTENFVRRYGTFIHAFFAALSIGITWYISSSVNAADLHSRVNKNTEEIREIKTSMQSLLSREVYEAHRRGDVQQAERMEKMLIQILNDQRSNR